MPEEKSQVPAVGFDLRTALILVLFTVAAFAIHGYHYGIEDQAIYLPAIKQMVNPQLYPHDSIFFAPQTKSTISGWLVAESIKVTHLPTDKAVFAWQVASIYLFLAGCWTVAARLFGSARARWGSVALVTTLLTLPVAGTALYLVDQYLHPRTLAMALVLMAVALVWDGRGSKPSAGRLLAAGGLVFVAALIHVMMAGFGFAFIVALLVPAEWLKIEQATFAMMAVPLSHFFEPGSPDWLEATRTRSQHYLVRWEWFEWLGIFGPLIVLWALAKLAQKKKLAAVRELALRTIWYGAVFFVMALFTIPARFERFTPYQPMRAYHIVYLVLVLVGGGLLAEFVMKNKLWRWAVLMLPIAAGMFFAQRDLFQSSRHIEWPGVSTHNQWVEAFDWVKKNTPQDAYFALDPHYISARGEDYHGFRGLAERSQIADWDKDPGVVSLFPNSAKRWHDEVHAVLGWKEFRKRDLVVLRQRFGVNWVIFAPEGVVRMEIRNSVNDVAGQDKKNDEAPIFATPGALDCPFHNSAVYVCRIP